MSIPLGHNVPPLYTGAGANLDLADLHLAFDLDRFGMFDFRKGQAIIEAGRRQAAPEVEALARRRAETDAGP